MLINIEAKLKGKRPLGRIQNRCLKFVREHFDQISRIRDKGYSWKQIADTVQSIIHMRSTNLPNSLATAFSKLKRSGRHA